MKTVYIITLISIIIVIILAFIILFYKYYNEKLSNLFKKLNDSESEYTTRFNNKFDIVNRFIDAIKDKYKTDSKVFDSVKDIQDLDISLKNEKLLNKAYKELVQIKEDKQKVREIKLFRELINEYEENELSLISLRTYYNSYTVIYNNLVSKFPYNIISKCKKYKVKNLIEGKELETDFNNDLEV
jgi:hypothetical protein